jgi:hypothetical protein
MHAVEPPEFFHRLDDDELLSARNGIEETLDWANQHCCATIGMFWAWRVNLSQTNAEITRRMWELT